MKIAALLAAALPLAALAAAPAAAQDTGADATYAELELRRRLRRDPRVIELSSGGDHRRLQARLALHRLHRRARPTCA